MVNESENLIDVTCVIDSVDPNPTNVNITKEGDTNEYKNDFVSSESINNTCRVEMKVAMKFKRADNGLEIRWHVNGNKQVIISQGVALHVKCE